MSKIFVVLFIFLYGSLALSEEILNRLVGPGILHSKFYDNEGPWAIDVLEIDLTNSNISIESVKANDNIVGREKTSTMARRKDRNGHWVVAAINADFFNPNGSSINCQVVNGTILKTPNKNSVLGIAENLKPFIEILKCYSEIISHNDIHKVDGVNRGRDTDELLLYNHYYGTNTKTNIWGSEVRFQTIDNWAVNDTFRIKVIDVDSTIGNQNIPTKGGVLSGHGTSRNWLLANSSVGDTLHLILRLNPIKNRIMEIVGGTPRIIRNGRISIEEGFVNSNFANKRHPRTAVGFSKDSTKLILFTVDGRQPDYSVGMTLREEAEHLLDLGVYHAINLDGGGSTTMVVHHKIENRPSDPDGERAVSNALLVISKIPLDGFSKLNSNPKTFKDDQGQEFQFKIKEIDQIKPHANLIIRHGFIWNLN